MARKTDRTSSSSSSTPPNGVFEYARAVLKDTREELGRADQKSSILFGAFGIVVSALGVVLISEDWTPFALDDRFEWLWWFGLLLSGAGLSLLALAVVPRMRHSEDRLRVSYFGHVVAIGTREDLRDAVAAAASNPLDRVVDQLFVVSRIVERKYRLTRNAMQCMAGSAGAITLSVVLDHLFGK
jgi:hypothetical protein